MHKFLYWLISSNFPFHCHILGLKFSYKLSFQKCSIAFCLSLLVSKFLMHMLTFCLLLCSLVLILVSLIFLAVLQLTEVLTILFLWVTLAFIQCMLLGKENLSFQCAFQFGPNFKLGTTFILYWKAESLISKSWFRIFCGFCDCDL